MDNLPGLVSQAAIPIGVERKRLAKFEASQPPLHSDTPGARLDQGLQFADTLLDDVRGLRTDGKPECSVIAAHLFHTLRTNRLHRTHQSPKELIRQRVFKEINFVHVYLSSQTSVVVRPSN